MPTASSIDNPVLNSPYTEPTRHFRLDADNQITSVIDAGRRASTYFLPIAAPKKKGVPSLFDALEETREESGHVNRIRQLVKIWRDLGWPDITPVTRALLEHWRAGDRSRDLFFCQIEALETLIYMVHPARRLTYNEDIHPERISPRRCLMAPKVLLRELTPEQRRAVEDLAHSRTTEARLVERARIILETAEGLGPSAVARKLGISRPTVYTWVHRFNAQGPDGLQDQPRSGRPATYPPEQVAEVIAAALTDPKTLGLPFGCWTLDRLQAYLNEHRKIPIKRSRIDEILLAEGLRWRHQESGFGERVDPEFAAKRGAIERPYTQPPEGAVVVCLDEMGPQAPKSTPGQELVHAAPGVEPDGTPRPAGRAKRAIETGRRGRGGYVSGAFRPATGAAFTHSYTRRNGANGLDFLERAEAWIEPEVGRVYAILENLPAHRMTDVLLFSLGHPRWEFVSQPKYAAYLNLIEPWWKVLRSLALKGRVFRSWAEVEQAVEAATAYWNGHRHPFVWGRRRRHRPRRRPGIAAVPGVRKLAG